MGCEPELLKKEAMPDRDAEARPPSEGVPPLTSLYMYISGSCNLACRHCWIEPDFQAEKRNGKFLKIGIPEKSHKRSQTTRPAIG